jgi:hypothetical protein
VQPDPETLRGRLFRQFGLTITALERSLALAVFLGVLAYLVGSVQVLLAMNWTATETFYELIYRVLLLVIGLELMRMLVTHELESFLELLAFVIARKMLKPDLTSLDIGVSVFSFVALVAARCYMFNRPGLRYGAAEEHAAPRQPIEVDGASKQ